MSLTRRVAYNTIVQVIGKVITTLISLVLIAALTRYLGVSGFGEYTTIFAYVQFFAIMADFGFFWFLVREMAKEERGQDTLKITNNVLTFRTFVALGIFGLGILISLLIPQYRDLRAGIAIISFGAFWMALNGTYIGIFQNKLRMEKAAITDLLGRLVILGIVLYLIKEQATLERILWAYFFGNLINFFASAYLGRVYLRFRPGFDFTLWRKIFSECLPISIVTILGMIYFKMDTVILSLLKTSTDVGIYGPPYKMLEILLLYPTIFMGNVFPIIARYIHTKDKRLSIAFQKSFDFLFVSAVPVVVGIILTAPAIIRIVGGQEFITASTVPPIFGLAATSTLSLQILIVAVGISFITHLFGYAVIALGKQGKLIAPNAFLVIFNISLNLILIPKISYIGAALATVLTESLVVFLYFRVMKRYFKIKIHLGILRKASLAGIILGLVLYYLKFLSLWLLVPLGVIVYLASLWAVKGISREMIKQVLRFEK